MTNIECSECYARVGENCTWGTSAKEQSRKGGLTLETAKNQLASTRRLRGVCVNPDQLEEGIAALEAKVSSLGGNP
jgi:hypothetical protein